MTSKLDPDQKFAIATITRQQIVDRINEVLLDIEAPPLAVDNPRLTDSMCQMIADGLDELNAETFGRCEDECLNAEEDFWLRIADLFIDPTAVTDGRE